MLPHALQHVLVMNKSRPHQTRQRAMGQNTRPEVGSCRDTEGGKIQPIAQQILHSGLAQNTRDKNGSGKVVEDDARDARQNIEEECRDKVAHAKNGRNASVSKELCDGGSEVIVAGRFNENEHGEKEERHLPGECFDDICNGVQIVPVEDEVLDKCQNEHEHGDVPEFDDGPAVLNGG